MTQLVAFPTSHPGGMDSELGAHFGHCDIYTLVEVVDGQVGETRVIPNVPHQQGGCMAPVMHLAQHGVKTLVAGGMGLRPLMGFNQVGIEVFFGGESRTVSEAIQNLLAGNLPRFEQQHTCGGGGGAASGGMGI
jgi:predicted Fe-Mo cluster-binding NifX family protein